MPAAFLCADARLAYAELKVNFVEGFAVQVSRLTLLRASPFWFKVQNCSGRGAPRLYKVQELVSPSLMVQ